MIDINHFMLDMMTSVENNNNKHKSNKTDSIIVTKQNKVLSDLIDINDNVNLSDQIKEEEFSKVAIYHVWFTYLITLY